MTIIYRYRTSLVICVALTISIITTLLGSSYKYTRNDIGMDTSLSVASISDSNIDCAKVEALAISADSKLEEWYPSATYLNLTHMYPEDADQNNTLESYAAIVYKEIFNLDETWYAKIFDSTDTRPLIMAHKLGYNDGYVTGAYNVSDSTQNIDDQSTWIISKWSNINTFMTDANGETDDGSSNAKEILAMANVYAYYHNWSDYEQYIEYAKNLWTRSHSYKFTMSQVYYCNGCLSDKEIEDAIKEDSTKDTSDNILESTVAMQETFNQDKQQLELVQTASTSNSESDKIQEIGPGITKPTQDTQEDIVTTDNISINYPKCPGHIDLNVFTEVYGLDGNNNLFSIDNIGNDTSNYNDSWQGWDQEKINQVKILDAMDWYDDFGLSVSEFSIGVPLSEAQINEYLNELPSGLSEVRKSIINYALKSVGNVPYYFGGKPSAPDYPENKFYSIVSPDYKGRIFKGLDCSGWLNWVYWSVNGNSLNVQSTSGLISCGKSINRSELQPGDIIVRTVSDETMGHVVMFLKWSDRGNMVCIHETGGLTRNVTVSDISAYWNYRNILD